MNESKRCPAVVTRDGYHFRCQLDEGHQGEHTHTIAWTWGDINAMQTALFSPAEGYPHGVAGSYPSPAYPEADNHHRVVTSGTH